MANRLFQTILNQMQSIFTDRKAGIITESGNIIACTDISKIGDTWETPISSILSDSNDTATAEGYAFRRFGGRSKCEYIAFCEGTDELAKTTVGVLSISLMQVKQFYDEKYDKLSFIKNILADNIMPGDIHLKSRALHLNTEVFRVAFLIRAESDDMDIFEVITGMFPDENHDFVVSMNETDVVLIKEVKEDTSQKELLKIANSIVDTVGSEIMAKVNVGIGSIVSTTIEINRSYKDASVALEVGRVFDNNLQIVSYNNLGIGRLIYQLPTKLCQLFLNEVFKKGTLDLLDDETIMTIQKFFENNLNVSSASRHLFVHRNTLVYRLDKIYKLTGLDLRHFDDAIVFKVAMMVRKYLGSDTINI